MNYSMPNIEAERVRRNISRAEFAELMGVTRRTVINWQNGSTEIPMSKLVRLAQEWGVSVDYLLGLDTPVKN